MTQMREHTVGDLVAERFELLGQLGAGGMGTVWQARDLLLESEVALKEMRSSGTEDPGESAVLKERVLREARVLARVRRPNVVTVHEVLDQQPYPWLVMELIVGCSLRELRHNGTSRALKARPTPTTPTLAPTAGSVRSEPSHTSPAADPSAIIPAPSTAPAVWQTTEVCTPGPNYR